MGLMAPADRAVRHPAREQAAIFTAEAGHRSVARRRDGAEDSRTCAPERRLPKAFQFRFQAIVPQQF